MSVAAAASGHHVFVLFQHHVLVIIKVEQVDGEELVGHAARRLDAFDQLQGVNYGLDSGVVGRPHVLAQGEGAGALAVVSVVPARRHDPTRPADLLEVHVEGEALAGPGRALFLAVVYRAGAAGRWSQHGGLGQAGSGRGVMWIWRRKKNCLISQKQKTNAQ